MRITDPNKDPLGAALLDHYSGQKNRDIEVFSELSDKDVLSTDILFRGWENMSKLEQKALETCGEYVLDIGAGAGSHSYVLQLMGKKVEAMDISPGAVEVMQKRKIQTVWHEDFFEMKTGKFDSLLLLMNGIGIVGKIERLDDFFEQAKKLLAPGGKILLDSSDIRYMYEDGGFSLSTDSYYGEVKFRMKYKTAFSDPFSWLYIDQDLLVEYAGRSGFSVEILFEDHHFAYLAQLSADHA